MSKRYERQLILPEIGHNGQRRLSQARVLVIGAGGLGCSALQYLVAAGVGFIRIADADRVAENNLHRQILFTTMDLERAKVEAAKERLSKMNEEVCIEGWEVFATQGNIFDMLEDVDLVVDATDNIPTRYLINDACVLAQKPLVYGAIHRFEGQVSVFNYKGSAHYRDLFPTPPPPGVIPDCSTAGVIGVLPGIIGNYQAAECIKIIVAKGDILANQLLFIDVWKHRHTVFRYQKSEAGKQSLPKNKAALMRHHYGQSCQSSTLELALSIDGFHKALADKNTVFLDVRQAGESPLWDDTRVIRIPLDQLVEKQHRIPRGRKLIAFCQMGVRSRQAMAELRHFIPEKDLAYIPFSIHQILNYAVQMD